MHSFVTIFRNSNEIILQGNNFKFDFFFSFTMKIYNSVLIDSMMENSVINSTYIVRFILY